MPPGPEPALPAAPKKRRAWEHHEELYAGGCRTCWSIKRFGPPSERKGYRDDL
ncbi:hypothetical protein [Streptomyces misionensis]